MDGGAGGVDGALRLCRDFSHPRTRVGASGRPRALSRYLVHHRQRTLLRREGKVATRVEYVKRSDGRVDDLFYFRRALDEPEQRWSGVAWPIDASNARWKARFIWPFTTEFRIVGIDAEYSVALIATPDAKLAWVYARTSTLSSERYEAALAELRERGVDSDTLVMVPQPPAPE